MHTAVEIVLALFAGVLVLPVGFLVLQLVCSLPRYRPEVKRLGDEPKIAILIPAFDEAKVIGETLTHLKAGLCGNCRVIVIADNCSDETAEIAKRAGAEVVVRDNPKDRGKGFALRHGIQHLKAQPPDTVIIVDADCEVHGGAIEQLAWIVRATGRPAQALYLMCASAGEGLNQQVSAFAFKLKNFCRLLGLKRLRLASPLVGTGMAFPWSVISAADLGTDNLVEDMKLGVDLVQAGFPPQFCPEALVTSHFPNTERALRSQRTRWEHGHLQLLLSEAPRLAWSSIKHHRWKALLFALDLSIPPLSLLLYLLLTGLGVTAAAYALGTSPIPFAMLTVTGCAFGASVLLVWWRYGKEILPPKALGAVPVYILSKFGLYLKYVSDRQKQWQRTDRG